MKEPKSRLAIPEVPDFLSDSGKQSWLRMAKILYGMGVLTNLDAPALERMMEAYEEIVACRELIKNDGHTYKTTDQNGNLQIKANPAVNQMRSADKQFKAYLTEFGLTPASRSRIVMDDVPETDEDDPLKEFFG